MMNQTILVNEIGYNPKGQKRALYRGESVEDFIIVEAKSGLEVYHGPQSFTYEYSAADEKHRILNFDDFDKPGEYLIRIGDEKSVPFVIEEKVYS